MIENICTLIVGFQVGCWALEKFKAWRAARAVTVALTHAEILQIAEVVIDFKVNRGELERVE